MSNIIEKLSNIISSMLLSGGGRGNSQLDWYGYALTQFEIAPTDKIPTMALTMDPITITPRIVYNPKFLEDKSEGEIVAVLLHELWHFMNLTHQRGELRDEEKWNFATDGVINWHVEKDLQGMYLSNSTIKLPDNCIRLPDTMKDEEIYSENIYKEINEGKNKELMKIWGQFQAGAISLVDDHSLWSTTADEIPEELIKQKIQQVVQEAERAAGSTPAGIKSKLDELLESKVPWRTLLRNFTGNHLKISTRPSWMRPNRRFPEQQPGRMIVRGGRIGIVVDTSGSTIPDRPQFYGEIDELDRTWEVWYTECDTDATEPRKWNKRKHPTVHGGGGTDMNPGLKKIMKVQPDIVIVLTDGYLYNGPIETGKPELWVICQSGQPISGKRNIQIED